MEWVHSRQWQGRQVSLFVGGCLWSWVALVLMEQCMWMQAYCVVGVPVLQSCFCYCLLLPAAACWPSGPLEPV